MNTTLPKLQAHLKQLKLQLQWAEYAYIRTDNKTQPNYELLRFQHQKIKELRQQIADTEYTIEQAELSHISIADVIGLPTQQIDGLVFVHFQNVAQ